VSTCYISFAGSTTSPQQRGNYSAVEEGYCLSHQCNSCRREIYAALFPYHFDQKKSSSCDDALCLSIAVTWRWSLRRRIARYIL